MPGRRVGGAPAPHSTVGDRPRRHHRSRPRSRHRGGTTCGCVSDNPPTRAGRSGTMDRTAGGGGAGDGDGGERTGRRDGGPGGRIRDRDRRSEPARAAHRGGGRRDPVVVDGFRVGGQGRPAGRRPIRPGHRRAGRALVVGHLAAAHPAGRRWCSSPRARSPPSGCWPRPTCSPGCWPRGPPRNGCWPRCRRIAAGGRGRGRARAAGRRGRGHSGRADPRGSSSGPRTMLHAAVLDVELVAFDDADFAELVERAATHGPQRVEQVLRTSGDLIALVVVGVRRGGHRGRAAPRAGTGRAAGRAAAGLGLGPVGAADVRLDRAHDLRATAAVGDQRPDHRPGPGRRGARVHQPAGAARRAPADRRRAHR